MSRLVTAALILVGLYWLAGAVGSFLVVALVIVLLPYQLLRDRRRRLRRAAAHPADNNVHGFKLLNARGFDEAGIPYL